MERNHYARADGLYLGFLIVPPDGAVECGPPPMQDGALIGGLRWDGAAWAPVADAKPPGEDDSAPATATRTAALIALYRSHGITEADIEAKIEDPEVIPDAGARYEAGLRFRSPTWERASVLLMQLAAAFDLTDEDVDALFRLARQIEEGTA